jgi:hypothetical protein
MRETQQMGVLEAARPKGRASRQGNHLFFIAPLIPARKAGIAGCAPGQQPVRNSLTIPVLLRKKLRKQDGQFRRIAGAIRRLFAIPSLSFFV